MIPKDIIMLDFIWYFNFDRDIEDNLLSKGFKVAAGNLYSSHYPRFNSRIKKDGMVGGEVSMWLIADEEILAENGKLWDVMYLSEMLWNTDAYDERNRRSYTEAIAKFVQPCTRDKIRGEYHPNGYDEYDINFSGESAFIPSALRAAAPNAIIANGEFSQPNECYDRIAFTHASLHKSEKISWKKNLLMGEYKITYEDGSDFSVPIRYANQVMQYNIPYAEPKPHQYYRHFGYVGTWFSDPAYHSKADDGSDVVLLKLTVDNPYPQKNITKIEYKREECDYCTLVLAKVTGLKKR